MIEEIIKNLEIPISCKVGRKLFKKQFLENFSLSVNEKKILSDDIESITLEYLLNKDNINIIPFVDEDSDYSEVAFIKVEIHNQNKLKQISTIVQNIPYPLIVFIFNNNSLCINISPKRINKSDSSKLVVVENYFTKWIDLDGVNELDKEFIESLNIHKHPFTDFLSFYQSYTDKVIAFNASEYSGMLNATTKTKEVLDEISNTEIKIVELKNKIKKETNFNNKVNLNVELKQYTSKLNNLKKLIGKL